MADVLDIETFSFESPMGEDEFLELLKKRNVIAMVVEDPADDSVRGYIIYELHKKWLYIVSLAVHPDHRRQGFGTALIKKMVSKLSSTARNRLVTRVSDRNLQGQLFLKALGLKATGIEKEHYLDDSDAYRFEYEIYEHLFARETV